ncbi:ABC transporter substrate-binding protein [Rossellomorea sp. YZS02]|uniref:ABC transporter substrate-binding protein n=1 Tax=Rossellomorea sp. YZS02 TaxID=3097358 RepID=UPI002A1559DF|nr:ABC transporter substrate-binding protein [Rossellomorea sp. YZS02]MDX8342573.1 ABC transporter substrate-binding protein [Rossellomorea sp. YZS02]
MENKLLTLWRYYPSGSIRVEEISETLQLSHKQTSRYLKKWNEEGWIAFTPGRGRGNVSTLKWKKDVEEEFEEEVVRRMDEDPIDESSKYLMYNWSTDSKMRLMTHFHSKLGFVKESKDKLIVPKRYPFFSIHPLEAADVMSAHLVANVFNRLVSITVDGDILPELAHSWDSSTSKLRFYLKKDVRFHDGSILTARDVVHCLEQLKNCHHYQELWEPIEEIEVKGPLIIDIHHPGGCSYILPMLTMMCASIYKETKGRTFGTGCFSLEENTDSKTTLTAFKEHFQERPLLDAVEFVQVPKDFKGIYHSHIDDNQSTSVEVESDSGFGIIVMNALPGRDSQIQRKEVRDYLHWVIAKYRHTLRDLDPRLTPNGKSIIVGQDQGMTITEVDRPLFTEPLVIRCANHTAKTTEWLVEIFKKEEIPVDVQWFSFADTLTRQPETFHVDLFVHGEIFESNQDFSFYHFLKNGYSPLQGLFEKGSPWKAYLDKYCHTPFEKWNELNMTLEKKLMEESIMIPLYYEKRYIPFSTDIMNIEFKHFGYVDFSRLWVRPEV